MKDVKPGVHRTWTGAYGWVVCLVLLSALILAGCKPDPRVEFIQGTWYSLNAHLANIPAESAQETTWVFDHGYVEISACCFVETYFSGSYSIADKKEDEVTLDLFNLQGQNGGMNLTRKDTLTLVIRINEIDDTIKINGDGPYTRVAP